MQKVIEMNPYRKLLALTSMQVLRLFAILTATSTASPTFSEGGSDSVVSSGCKYNKINLKYISIIEYLEIRDSYR
jgi:hypothetical protein